MFSDQENYATFVVSTRLPNTTRVAASPSQNGRPLGPTRRLTRRVASDGGEVGCVICSSISYALLAMAHTSIRHLDFSGKNGERKA